MYRALKLCAQGGGYEAIPEPAKRLDLHQLRLRLASEGVTVVDARVMLIARLPPEVTIGRSGRLLFKTPDPDEAGRALERLAPLIEASSRVAPRASPTG